MNLPENKKGRKRFRFFNKYKIGNKRFWNSPIICEGCNQKVESISNNPILGQIKWLCPECAKKEGRE